MKVLSSPGETDNSLNDDRIAWHPAFFEAIQMELDEYSNDLQFISEYQLTTEPLRIDVVIIKKSTDIQIKKNIASIFRKVNIMEYKSPDDYVSVKDFYLVYGYACLYKALNEVDIKDLTLNFVESRYPRELVRHLKEERNFHIEEKWPGVYIVTGDVLPIQIIDSRRLSTDENIWLRDLDNKLEADEVLQVASEIFRQGKEANIKAYLAAILKANKASFREALKMYDVDLSLEKTMEEFGLLAKWEARGEVRGEARGEEKKAVEIAQKMLGNGFPVEQIANLSGLDIEKIEALTNK